MHRKMFEGNRHLIPSQWGKVYNTHHHWAKYIIPITKVSVFTCSPFHICFGHESPSTGYYDKWSGIYGIHITYQEWWKMQFHMADITKYITERIIYACLIQEGVCWNMFPHQHIFCIDVNDRLEYSSDAYPLYVFLTNGQLRRTFVKTNSWI